MNIQLSEHFTYHKLFRFVLPSIVMMVFTSVYGVVDGLFVSNYAGKTAFAAINLIMPFLMIFGGIGFMFGTGGSALVAKTLGEGKNKMAARYFSMIIIAAVITGMILTIVSILVMEPVAIWLGADEAMLGDCVLYGNIAMLFSVTFMLQNAFQSFFIAAQKPELGLKMTLAAGITNMVLDALFVGGFRWGAAGAALATGLSQCVGGIIPFIYFCRPNTSLLKLCRTNIELKTVGKACWNGMSEFVTNVAASVVGIVYNFQLLKYAGADGVAANGVLMYIQFIFAAIFIGYSIGCSPIISYHYGAGNHSELKNMFHKSNIIMGVSGGVMFVSAMLLSSILPRIFVGYDKEVFTMTVDGFRIFAISFIFAGFNIFISSFFTALNDGSVSAAVSFLRTFVFKMAAVWIMPAIWGLSGIWWSVAAAEVIAFIISEIFIICNRKKYHY